MAWRMAGPMRVERLGRMAAMRSSAGGRSSRRNPWRRRTRPVRGRSPKSRKRRRHRPALRAPRPSRTAPLSRRRSHDDDGRFPRSRSDPTAGRRRRYRRSRSRGRRLSRCAPVVLRPRSRSRHSCRAGTRRRPRARGGRAACRPARRAMCRPAIGVRLDRGVEIDVLAIGEPLEHAPRVGPQQLELPPDLGKSSACSARAMSSSVVASYEPGLGEAAPGASIARPLVVPLVVVVDTMARREIPELALELARESADRVDNRCRRLSRRRSASPADRSPRVPTTRRARGAGSPRSRSRHARASAQHLGRNRRTVRAHFAQARLELGEPQLLLHQLGTRGAAERRPARPKPRPTRRRRCPRRRRRASTLGRPAIGSGFVPGGGVRRSGRAIAPRASSRVGGPKSARQDSTCAAVV